MEQMTGSLRKICIVFMILILVDSQLFEEIVDGNAQPFHFFYVDHAFIDDDAGPSVDKVLDLLVFDRNVRQQYL